MSALVQTQDFSPPGVSSYTATMASAFTVGNTVVVDFGGSTGAYITAITGGGVTTWNQATLSAGQGTGPTYTGIWYGVVTSSGSTSIAVTYSEATSTFDPLVVSEWTGALTVDVAGSTGGDRTVNATSPTLTPSAAGDVAVAVVRLRSGTVSNTMPSPWTALGSRAGHSGNASAYQASASASDQTLNWTEAFSNPDYWSSSLVLLKVGGTTQSGAATLSGSGTLTGSASANIKAAASLSASGSISATISGPRFEVVGHSYAVGEGLTDTTLRSSTVLANDRGYTEVNYGVGGSGATLDHNALGGWVTAANSLARDGSSPYLKQTDYGLVWYGINDVGHLPTWGAKDQMFFSQGMRFVISRMCASRIFDDTDSSITYSGFSSNSIGSDYGTGSTDRRSTTGGTVTITVPSDFPGGTVAVYPVTYNNQGATWSFTVDGVAAGSLDLDATGESFSSGTGGLSFGFAKRFTGLAAGTHTIVCTVTGVTGATYFDSWAIEASTPPITLVPGQFKLSSTGYANYTTHVPTDADIDALNANIQSVVAEFPSQVRYVDLSSLDYMTDMQSNELEPDETGYSRMTALLEAAITGSTKDGSSSLSGTGNLTASGSRIQNVVSAISGSGSLTASVTAYRITGSPLSGSSSLAATGVLTLSGASSIGGSGSLSATGTHIYIGQSNLAGTGSFTASGIRYVQPLASLSGSGSLSGTPPTINQAVLVGTSSLSATPTAFRIIQATLSGNGSISANGIRTAYGMLSATGSGTLSASAQSNLSGQSYLSGSGSLTATSSTLINSDSILSATGSLSVYPTAYRITSASLNGITQLDTKGNIAANAEADLSTQSDLSSIPTVFLQSGISSLEGIGALLGSPGLIKYYSGNLSGLGSLIASAGVTQTSSSSLFGQSEFNIVPTVTGHGQGSLSGQGTISFDGNTIALGNSALNGEGTLSAQAIRNVLGISNLSGDGEFSSTAKIDYSGDSNLVGISNLSAGAGTLNYQFGTANLDGGSNATIDSQIILSGLSLLYGDGSSSAIGTRIRLADSELMSEGDISAIGLRYGGGLVSLSGQGSLNSILGQIIGSNSNLSGLGDIASNGMVTLYGLGSLSGDSDAQPLGSLIFTAQSDQIGIGDLLGEGDRFIGSWANLSNSSNLIAVYSKIAGGFAHFSGSGWLHADTYIQTWDAPLIRVYTSGTKVNIIDARMNRELDARHSTGRVVVTKKSFEAIPGPITKIIPTEENDVSMHNNQEVLFLT